MPLGRSQHPGTSSRHAAGDWLSNWGTFGHPRSGRRYQAYLVARYVTAIERHSRRGNESALFQRAVQLADPVAVGRINEANAHVSVGVISQNLLCIDLLAWTQRSHEEDDPSAELVRSTPE